eukprot:363925-Chlamydomonas_euryale.AAC.20
MRHSALHARYARCAINICCATPCLWRDQVGGAAYSCIHDGQLWRMKSAWGGVGTGFSSNGACMGVPMPFGGISRIALYCAG